MSKKKTKTNTPKVTIDSIEFCKPLREGIITESQITHQPLINLKRIPENSKTKITYELNVLTFLLESLDFCPKPKGDYHVVPIDTSIPFIKRVLNRIWFGYLGQIENRHHFDIRYNYNVEEEGKEKDYMLVYLRVKYSVKYPKDRLSKKEQIIVTENYDKHIGRFEPETDRGTKTTKRIIDDIGKI